jgi:hypothetical protein
LQKLLKEQNKMAELKHVGRIISTGKKCIVAFRTLPGDSDRCLIVPTENLPDSYHDAIINLVESNAGQSAYEFGEVMCRSNFPDGSIMLAALHVQQRMQSVGTSEIEMLPTPATSIVLSELNQIIAEQRGLTVGDLSIKNPSMLDPKVEVTEVGAAHDISPTPGEDLHKTVEERKAEAAMALLTPEDQAKKFRSDADRLSKEAAELRRQAEALVPTKKKAVAVE